MSHFRKIEREDLSALYDGENFPANESKLDDNSLACIQNWSMIGATMRQEMSKQVDLNFANSIMNKIENENIKPDTVDQADVIVNATKVQNVSMVFKRIGLTVVQMAVAASVAVVTIIGYQTYNADKNISTDTFNTASIGNLGAANLASYQSNRDVNKVTVNTENKKQIDNEKDSLTVLKQRELELNRINTYIRGYVLDTASK